MVCCVRARLPCCPFPPSLPLKQKQMAVHPKITNQTVLSGSTCQSEPFYRPEVKDCPGVRSLVSNTKAQSVQFSSTRPLTGPPSLSRYTLKLLLQAVGSGGSLSFSHTASVFCLSFCSMNNDTV